MKAIDVTAALLLVIGGLNWGLVGMFGFDLVGFVFGSSDAVLARLVYLLVGLSAVYQAAGLKAIQSRWGVKGSLASA